MTLICSLFCVTIFFVAFAVFIFCNIDLSLTLFVSTSRLMAPDSVIQFVHKHMGLVPGWGGAARLVRIVGSQNALKLLGGAKKVDSEYGTQIGLASGILKPANGSSAQEEAEQWLGQYTKGPAAVIRAVKQVVVCGRELPLEDALRTEKDVFGTVWGGPANLAALASKSKHK